MSLKRWCLSLALSPLGLAAQPVDLKGFDAWIAQGVRDWNVPGLAVAVVKNDSVVFARGYGVLRLGGTERVDEHTRFSIGSTTKAMTALALLMLQDDGKLRLDDPVVRYLPALQLYDPVMTREITVRDLLTHHTGLPGSDLLWSGGGYETAEILRRMRWLRPMASFRNAFNYQNVQYAIAGEVVRAVSGMPWEDFIARRIHEPLGMRETLSLLSRTAGQPNVATPHLVIDDTVRVIENRSVDQVGAAGSVWSSVSDMARWMRFVLDSGRVGGKRLVSAASFREWLSPQVVAPLADFYPTTSLTRAHGATYGLGWFLHDYRGMQVAMHTGSIDGLVAIIGLVPDERLGVYVLANLDHAELRHAIMFRGFDLFAPGHGPMRDWSKEFKALYDGIEQQGRAAQQRQLAARKTGTRPSLDPAGYAGTYADSLYGEARVTQEQGRLRVTFGMGGAAFLEHWHHDAFMAQWDDRRRGRTLLNFALDARGSVSALEAFGTRFGRRPSTQR